MANLLDEGSIEAKSENLRLHLCLHGGIKPMIEQDEKYRWELSVQGNKTFPYLKELSVEFAFDKSDPTILEIISCIPTKEKAEIATPGVTLDTSLIAVPGFSMGPISKITVNVPISKEKISCDIIDSTQVRWTFSDIDLSRSEIFSQHFEGVLIVRFSAKSKYTHQRIAMTINPTFCKIIPFLKIPRGSCIHPPKISRDYVVEKCIDIRPYDPEEGPIGLNEDERIIGYTHVKSQGLLKKGDIRNVSLRAETLSMFFNKLRSTLSDEEYSRIVKEAGKEIGENFIDNLTKLLRHRPNAEEWSKYDSSAGWGKFAVNEENNYVQVLNSFNAFNSKSEKPICYFLAGYLEGILPKIDTRFYGKSISISEINCIAKGDDFCTFDIKEKS